MVKTLFKSSVREIRHSLGRYLAIMAIVALGVGFFAGLRMCEPDMKATGRDYLETQRFHDIRLLSTLGFTEEDVAYFASLDQTETAAGAIYTTFLFTPREDAEDILIAHSLTEGINEPALLEGRLPESPNECLGDARYFTAEDIGRTIRVSPANDEDTLELLVYDEYILVGIANSPMYLNFERGTASIGDGSVDAFVLIPEAGFDAEAYFEIYLRLRDMDGAYTQSYNDSIDALKPEFERLAEERGDLRYATLYDDAMTEIADAEAELADGWAEYNDGLADFEEGKQEYADGLQEYEDGLAEIADAEVELADGWAEYEDGLAEYEDGRREYEDGLKEYEDGLAELADAEAELADGWAEYEKGKADYEKGLAEYNDGLEEYNKALDELTKAEEQLEDGWDEYYQNADRVHAELEDARRQLEDSEKAYEQGLAEYEAGIAQLQAGKATLDAKQTELDTVGEQLAASRAQLDEGYAGIAEGEAACKALEQLVAAGLAEQAALDEALSKLEASKAELAAGEAEYQAYYAEYEAGQAALGDAWEEYYTNEATLQAVKAELDQAPAQIESGWEAYYEGKSEADSALNSAWIQLNDAQIELDDGKAQLEEVRVELEDAESQLREAEAELADGLAELNDGQAELDDARAELADAKIELDDAGAQLRDAEAELADGLAELNDGQAELDDARKELREAEIELADAALEIEDAQLELDDAYIELTDGQAELDDAREELDELETPDVYVLTRSENVGYVSFDNNSNIIKAISVVFPVFFFLVAALVCMTTMTRMVDEQRVQIGVFKALGYSNSQILGKYLFYSGSAAITGSVVGYAACSICLPWVIWEIYGMMYNFAPLIYTFDPWLALISFAAAMLCSVGVTWLACRVELTHPAASLIRPKAPKAGKRVFLEWITPLWRRLSFLQKVSVRNVLRYHSRLVMMLLGIGGCTALLVTGFGLRDSVLSLAEIQFSRITHYDYGVTFRDAQTQDSLNTYLANCGWEADMGLLVCSENVDLVLDEGSKTVSMVVPASGSLDGFVTLRDDSGIIPFPGTGEAVISSGLSETLGIAAGDVLQLRDEELRTLTVTVSGICENYMGDYVYLSPETYRAQTDAAPVCKTLYLQAHEGADPIAESVKLSDGEKVVSVAVTATSLEQISSMLSRMDYVVVVVVICAAALAFIVLYNLTNINISERIREIATIKVLGFYRSEVASYVFRETYILSALGSLVGLVLGKLLHMFVMAQVKVDGIYFPTLVTPVSYAISVALTLVFTVLIALFMRKKLGGIDMAESLKSVE